MGWDKAWVIDKRMAFIVDYRSEDCCVAERCRRYGVSRRIGYKWRDRYEAEGPAGVVDRSRAPHDPGNALPEELAAAVVTLRGEYPHWGPKKLRARLERDRPGERGPAGDRKSGGEGKRVAGRVELGGRRTLKKKKKN